MKSHELKTRKRPKKKSRRRGRGLGTGRGSKSGRGQKGQKSRSGGRRGSRPGFEGGMSSFVKRMPKLPGQSKGAMKKPKRYKDSVSLSLLDRNFKDGDEITLKKLKRRKLVAKNAKTVKVVAGEAKKKFKFDKEIKLSKGVENKK